MRDVVTQKKRVVVKIGSSSLTHPTGKINLHKVEQLAVELTDIKNRGLDVVLVSPQHRRRDQRPRSGSKTGETRM